MQNRLKILEEKLKKIENELLKHWKTHSKNLNEIDKIKQWIEFQKIELKQSEIELEIELEKQKIK